MHYFEEQDIWLEYFAPTEFEHPDQMNAELLTNLDELRHRCGFPIKINDGYRTDADMAAIYGSDRSKWSNSPHMRGRGVDIEPHGDLTYAEFHRRKMVIMYHALAMWMEGKWPRLGLELADVHTHLDNDTENTRPFAWPGVSK